MLDQVRARVVRTDEGELIDVAGVQHLFKLTGADTQGRLGLERFDLAAGVIGARPHVHGGHDEYFFVVGGTLTVTTIDGDSLLEPGDLAHAPRGSLHGFRNDTGGPVQALCLYTPAGYERYFRDIHDAVLAGQEPTPALLAQLRARYDTVTI